MAQKKRHPRRPADLCGAGRLEKDFNGTLTAVAKMGHEGVELTQYELDARSRPRGAALLDSIKLRVFSTHTNPVLCSRRQMKAAIELNTSWAHGRSAAFEGWRRHRPASAIMPDGARDASKEFMDVLESASGVLKKNRMACSFHNHAVEFQAKDGVKPIDILAQAKDAVSH